MRFFEFLKTRWIVWVWNHTPNCAEMSCLASLSLERPHTWRTRLQMWLHWLICVWCQRYDKHLKFLHRAAPRLQGLEGAPSPKLSHDTKHRMVARLLEEFRH